MVAIRVRNHQGFDLESRRGIPGIDAAVLEDLGMDHAAAQDLHPARTLADRAALRPADEARDVHLGAGFG